MGKNEYLIYGRRTVAEFFRAGNGDADIGRAYLQNDLTAADLNVEPGHVFKNWNRATRRELDERFPEITHQGVVLVLTGGRRPHKKDTRWTEFVREKHGLLVALDEVQDPQNVGAIIRSAEALGAAGLLLTPKCAPLSSTVDRASAGASFHLPVFQDVGASNLVHTAAQAGYWIVASSGEDADEDRRRISAADPNALPPAGDLLLIIGSEGSGVRRLLLERADYIVSIPLAGQVRSLNASAAAAILLDRMINRS